jgi:glutathione S-transferase
MKLYSANLSPFAARVRLAIYAKGLPVEISYPPQGGLKAPEYLALNPMGKMPCLVTESGAGVPESAVILEYLEDSHPQPPLLPASAEDRARTRLVSRITEVYLGPPGSALFGQFDPSKRDKAVVEAQFEKLDEALGFLERCMGDGAYAVGDKLTLADCTLAPNLFYLMVFSRTFDRPNLLAKHPKLARYLERVRKDPHVAKIWDELDKAFAHYAATGEFS